MKLRFFIVSFAFCALLLGCHNPDIKALRLPTGSLHDTLVSMDSLLQTQPKMALEHLTILTDSIGIIDSTEFDRNYAFLMKSEALWKSYRTEEIDMETVAAVTAYFDSLASVFPQSDDLAYLQARSHFIYCRKGIVDKNESSTKVAGDSLFYCQQLYLALETMENHFSDENLTWHKARFTVRTAEELSVVYTSRFIMDPATYFQKMALALNQKIRPNSNAVAKNLFFIGYEFDVAEQIDSALHYYNRCLEVLTDTTFYMYYLSKDRQAIALYKTNHDGDASIKILKSVLAQAPESMKWDLYGTIGWIYQEERQYDSALAYLSPTYENSDSFLKSQVSDYLIKVYDALGDTAKVNEYSHYLALHPVFNPTKIQKDVEFTELFNNYLQQKETHKHLAQQKANLQQRNKTLVYIAVFIVLAALAAWLLHKRKMNAERQTHQVNQAALSGRLKRSNEELRELKDQIRQQNDAVVKSQTQAVDFIEEPICSLILERVNDGQFKSKVNYLSYKEYALSKEQVVVLREAADRHFSQFTVRLAKAYPDLTRSDLDYCCLYLLDLNDADIAALMQRTYNTVSERSRKLKALFGSEEPLSTILRGLASKELFS